MRAVVVEWSWATCSGHIDGSFLGDAVDIATDVEQLTAKMLLRFISSYRIAQSFKMISLFNKKTKKFLLWTYLPKFELKQVPLV